MKKTESKTVTKKGKKPANEKVKTQAKKTAGKAERKPRKTKVDKKLQEAFIHVEQQKMTGTVKFTIPENKLEEFYNLAFMKVRTGLFSHEIVNIEHTELYRYKTWKFVGELFPETVGRKCRLNTRMIRKPVVEMEIEDQEDSE